MQLAALLVCSVVLAPAAGIAKPFADTLIWHGPIYTADDAQPRVQAVAIRAGRIVFAGDEASAERLINPATRIIDLKGAAMYPGFTDAHAHLIEVGERELTLNLEGKASLADMLRAVRSRAATMPAGETLFGRGWIETHWPEGRFPNRQDLDAIAADRPILLKRADDHALVANSAALKRAGIDAQTKPPAGGDILKDASGAPTGMLIDAAMDLVAGVRPKVTPAFKAAAFHQAFTVYSHMGWTGVHNMSVDYDDALFLESSAEKGELPLRVYNALVPEAAARLIAEGPHSVADGRVITRTLKFYMDGALGSRGAALFDRYDDADTTGLIKLDMAAVAPVWRSALKHGIQIATHAIGDRANQLTLNGYEAALKAVPVAERKVADPRWRIEHAQTLTPSDIPRFAKLGVIPSMQPSHAIGDLYFAPKRLGPERLKGAYAWKSLINAGSIIAGGSDAPVERGDPRIEFYAAVTRKALNGFSGPDWHPEQAVDRATALKMFTLWPAFASFREHELGQIKVGDRADFTVFSVDIMTVPAPQILTAKPLMTMLDGKVAFRDTGW